jgi:hypothetical protein
MGACSEPTVTRQQRFHYLNEGINDVLSTCSDMQEVAGADAMRQGTLNQTSWERIREITDTLSFEPVRGGYYPYAQFTVGEDIFCLAPNLIWRDSSSVPVLNVVKNDTLYAASAEVYCLIESAMDHDGWARSECAEFGLP